MLETLLESKARRERSAHGTVVSVSAHAAIIGVAIYATSQARVHPIHSSDTIPRIVFSIPSTPVHDAAPTPGPQPSYSRRLVLTTPRIDIPVPRLEIGDITSRSGDFNPDAVATPGTDTQVARSASAEGSVLRADQVEKQVSLAPGNVPPKYPETLRNSGVEGQVTAQFVVDEHGHAEADSVRFVGSNNFMFEEAVRVALRRMRFVPAEVGGRKVRQLVQMPFVFTLSR